jgi:hypothetical protein
MSQRRPDETLEAFDQALEERVRRRMSDFYSQHLDLFRRHPACSLCDAPCTYYPPVESERIAELALWGEQFLTSILVGDSKLFSVWQRLDREMARGGSGRSPGQERCIRVLLATAVADHFYRSHPKARNWPAHLELQEGLARLWEHRYERIKDSQPLQEEVKAQVHALRLTLRQGIATAPAVERPGCGPCPVRCRFGHRLQPVNNPAVAPVLNRLKDATAEQPPDWAAVRRLAGEQVGLKLPERLEWEAAYCLITQASADPRLPAEALRRMRQLATSPVDEA